MIVAQIYGLSLCLASKVAGPDPCGRRIAKKTPVSRYEIRAITAWGHGPAQVVIVLVLLRALIGASYLSNLSIPRVCVQMEHCVLAVDKDKLRIRNKGARKGK